MALISNLGEAKPPSIIDTLISGSSCTCSLRSGPFFYFDKAEWDANLKLTNTLTNWELASSNLKLLPLIFGSSWKVIFGCCSPRPHKLQHRKPFIGIAETPASLFTLSISVPHESNVARWGFGDWQMGYWMTRCGAFGFNPSSLLGYEIVSCSASSRRKLTRISNLTKIGLET